MRVQMRDNSSKISFDQLPVTRNLTTEMVLSWVIVGFMGLASLIGIIYKSTIYPTEKLMVGFVATDFLNLIAGVPLTIFSLWYSRKGKLMGLLCWPGALFYVLYIYCSYLAVPLGFLFIPYLLLIILSGYALIGLISSVDRVKVRNQIQDAIPAKTIGWILLSIALMVIVYQVVKILSMTLNRSSPDNTVLIQWIDDLVIGCPAILIGGYLLLRQKALGYVVGAGLLIMCGLLFIGVIPAMIFQAIADNLPVDVIGILVVLITGMVCFIPLVLFIRGVRKSGL